MSTHVFEHVYAGDYHVAHKGGSCSTSTKVASASACKAAAWKLGYGFGESEDDASYPGGCYLYKGSSEVLKAYFNKNAGKAQSFSTPVCKGAKPYGD